MRQALAHVALLVRDYDEAIAWYAEKLGFELVADEAEDAKRWVVVRPRGAGDGATDLVLAQATPAQISAVGNQAGDRVFLFLRTDDFWRDHAAMTAKGVRFVREPKVEPYGTVAVFGGPVRKSLGPDRPVTMWRRGIEHAASALLHRLHHA